jgi:hypothetical protein
MKFSYVFNLLFVCGILLSPLLPAQTKAELTFHQLSDAPGWQSAMKDPGTRNWQRKWSLDGLRATVINTPGGMVFSAGPEEKDDACHGVLWTKKSFSGDLKISYTYTRTDTRNRLVNILYLYATGAKDKPKNIATWQNERIIPSMRTYFNQMNALHVSYAAFTGNNDGQPSDYVRARRYPVPTGGKFQNTALSPDYFDTSLFKPGIPYQITVIATHDRLYFHVEGDEKEQLFDWQISQENSLREGRIGLRQMYTRSARYGDFMVWERR